MADFTKIAIVSHPDTHEVIRVVFPVEGDHELDDMNAHMFHLDPGVNWQIEIVDRHDPRAGFGMVI